MPACAGDRMGAGMAHSNATRTLAEALSAVEARSRDQNNPLIDQLATALAVPAFDPGDYDDDDDLDLPMLVQGDRFGSVVPMAAPQRGREGRAALVGFGLGLVMLVPIGIGMSSLLPDRGALPIEATAAALVQSSVTTTVAYEEMGIRTTRAATQSIAPAPDLEPATPPPVLTETSPPAVTPVELKTTTAPVEPKATPAPVGSKPAVVPPESKIATARVENKTVEPPKPDRLAEAKALVATGDVESARTLLKPLAADNNPAALLMLAETFDPNMLAAWSARGAAADPDLARTLYKRAFAQGEIKARQRLEALE
jgi:hypothetical protein